MVTLRRIILTTVKPWLPGSYTSRETIPDTHTRVSTRSCSFQDLTKFRTQHRTIAYKYLKYTGDSKNVTYIGDSLRFNFVTFHNPVLKGRLQNCNTTLSFVNIHIQYNTYKGYFHVALLHSNGAPSPNPYMKKWCLENFSQMFFFSKTPAHSKNDIHTHSICCRPVPFTLSMKYLESETNWQESTNLILMIKTRVSTHHTCQPTFITSAVRCVDVRYRGRTTRLIARKAGSLTSPSDSMSSRS